MRLTRLVNIWPPFGGGRRSGGGSGVAGTTGGGLVRLVNLWPPFGRRTLSPSLPAAIRARLFRLVPEAEEVYYLQAAPRAARPYIIMFDLMSTPTITNAGTNYGSVVYQFSCVSDDDVEAERVGRSAIAALSIPDKLVFQGGRHMSGWVGTERKMIDTGPPESAGQAFRFDFDFTFLIQR